jgi:serine/threonine protein kinase
MNIIKILDEFEIESTSIHSDFTLSEAVLPKQRVDGKILTKEGKLRCTLLYDEVKNQGRYGLIQKCRRYQGNHEKLVVVKRPRSPSISLAPEALLQALCFKTAMDHGLKGSISKPFDLFLFANEVRFTMELIDGISFKEFLFQSRDTFESDFLNCLAQLCFILSILQTELKFDHRDLRIENIWIRPLAVEENYRVPIGSEFFLLKFKFQLVLLDFGFACMGDLKGRAIVNLGNGVFSHLDSCPKAGRDIYQFLNSCLEIKEIRQKISEELMAKFINWMEPYKIIPATLSYLITYQDTFANARLQPCEFLKWYGVLNSGTI